MIGNKAFRFIARQYSINRFQILINHSPPSHWFYFQFQGKEYNPGP